MGLFPDLFETTSVMTQETSKRTLIHQIIGINWNKRLPEKGVA